MKIVTLAVSPDEPCYGLREERRGSRWVQTVFVVRDDTIASHATDIGPAENFTHVTPLMMPSFGDDTVAQLREHAEKNRHDTYWYERGQEQLKNSTLIRDHINQLERKAAIVRRHPRTSKEIARAIR